MLYVHVFLNTKDHRQIVNQNVLLMLNVQQIELAINTSVQILVLELVESMHVVKLFTINQFAVVHLVTLAIHSIDVTKVLNFPYKSF